MYALSGAATVSDERIEEILREALLCAPSAFNSQSARIVLLLHHDHADFWDAVTGVLRPIAASPEAFEKTKEKILSFKNAYGTVLFFEDQETVGGFQEKFPLYKEQFAEWSLVSAGMLQYIVWTSLAAEGMGASLQHYNPLIDGWVREKTGVPPSWRLCAEMPFGIPTAPAGEKASAPIEQRLKVFSS